MSSKVKGDLMILSDLLDGYRVETLTGDRDRPVSALCDDSRKVVPDSLFFAVKGARTDGNRYIPDAIKRGARVVVSEQNHKPSGDYTFVKVQDIHDAMAFLADRFYGHPSGSFGLVGITGTNGKTTTAYLIYQMLRLLGKKTGLIGTINYIIGDTVMKATLTTPTAIQFQRLLDRMREASMEYVVTEVSSHALDQRRVEYSDFDVAVFTNLSRDHLDYHGDMDSYFRAKERLFLELNPLRAVINMDDSYGNRLLDSLKEKETDIIGYGLSLSADLYAVDISTGTWGTEFGLYYQGHFYSRVKSRLLGIVNIYNMLAAIGSMIALGFDLKDILALCESLNPAEGRMEIINEGQPYTVVVDYAHTPDALEKLLETLRGLGGKRLITLFGCGGDRDRGKRPLMGEIASGLSDYVFITSDNPRTEKPQQIVEDIVKGIRSDNYTVVLDRREAIFRAVEFCNPGDILVVAGKGHEDYQEINGKRIPFDDRNTVRQAIKHRLKRTFQ